MKIVPSLGLAFLFWVTILKAQQSDIQIKNIDVDLRHAPFYTVRAEKQNNQLDSSRKWLVIEIELESLVEWADEVTLKAYVVANYGSNSKDVPVDGYDVLSTNVTIVNLQRTNGAKKNIVPFFMDPNTVRRYGQANLQKFIPEVTVQVTYRGVLQDTRWMKNERENGRFWEQKQPKNGILLNLNQSPWWPAFADYYEQLKPSTPN